jgi:hypothetical protein
MAGYIGNSTLTGCDAGARQPDVIAELKGLGYVAESVRTTAQRLEERLAGVLRQPCPTNCGKDPEPAPLCPVAEAIRREASIVRSADAILVDLLDRLEV